jgi:hypothetical protein
MERDAMAMIRLLFQPFEPGREVIYGRLTIAAVIL